MAFRSRVHHWLGWPAILICRRADQPLIDNWNAHLGPSDTVFVVSDFAHKADNGRAENIFGKLRGTKHLVIGNQDSEFVRTQLLWARVMDRTKITVDGQKIDLYHYLMRS